MAILNWIDFSNGDTGLAVRNAINTFNTNVEAQVNTNTTAKDANTAAITALLDPDWTDYDPQVTKPAWQEGRLFYTDECQDICVHTDVTNVAVSLGQMTTMRVNNNTGNTILKGQVCTYNGAAAGFPIVKLAIADTPRNAIVLGVALHDIPTGTIGFLVTNGKIQEVNTSGFVAGVPLFLSDTIPGAMVALAPDIVSQIGGATQIGITDGKFFVNIRSNIEPVSAIGFLSGAPVNSYPLTAIPTNLVAYTDADAVIMTTNKLLGTIKGVGTGIYRGTFTGSFSFPSTTTTRSVIFELYNVTQATTVGSLTTNIPRDATSNGVSFTSPFTATDGDEFVIRMTSNPNITISFTSMVFEIETVHVR